MDEDALNKCLKHVIKKMSRADLEIYAMGNAVLARVLTENFTEDEVQYIDICLPGMQADDGERYEHLTKDVQFEIQRMMKSRN